MTTWKREADAEEAWVLASGTLGWVTPSEMTHVASLNQQIAALQARRDTLQDEVETACALGRVAGAAEGRQAIRALLEAMERSHAERVTRAAEAALAAAEALVSGQLEAHPEHGRALVEQALHHAETRSVRALRVAPSMAAAVEVLVAELQHNARVLGDVQLGVGDVVLVFDDGQQPCLLAGLLEALRSDVVVHVIGDE